MNRIFTAIFIMMFSTPAFAEQIPASSMENLAGQVVEVPKAFDGKPTLVILAFAHEQRDEGKRVIELLAQAQKENPSIKWFEMPVIDAPGIAHMFIRGGMRDGTDESLHPQIVPQFVDEDEWHEASGIKEKNAILTLVDDKGTILKSAPLGEVKTVDDVNKFSKISSSKSTRK